MGFNGIAATFLGGLNPIGTIFSSYFIQHITSGGAYLDKSIYPSQIADLISAIIIYLCGFVLFFKLIMNKHRSKAGEEKKAGEGKEEGMILLIQYTLIFASVLSLVALGGCFSEHSGVINLGLEGVMVMGALGGALCMKTCRQAPAVRDSLWSSSLRLFGHALPMLLGVACINFKADQTLVGTAMNILSTAAATVIVKAINMAENPDNVSSTVSTDPGRRRRSSSRSALRVQLVHAGRGDAAHRCLCRALQDEVRPSPHGLRREPAGGGQRRHQCLQDALGRRPDLGRTRRPRRHRVHHGRRFRVEI